GYRCLGLNGIGRFGGRLYQWYKTRQPPRRSQMEERRVALVSGANRGIGREVVRLLARRGMAVALGARDPRAGDEAAARLRRQRLDVRPYQLDVTDPVSVEAAAQRLEGEFGRLDVLVNNAGVYPEGDAASMDMATAELSWQ